MKVNLNVNDKPCLSAFAKCKPHTLRVLFGHYQLGLQGYYSLSKGGSLTLFWKQNIAKRVVFPALKRETT